MVHIARLARATLIGIAYYMSEHDSQIEKFKFDNQITTLAEKNLLYIVLKEFTTPKADLHPNKISNLEMGYIFEEIIRKFSEAHNEDAGQHYIWEFYSLYNRTVS